MAEFTMEIQDVGTLPITPVFAPRIEYHARNDGTIQSYREIWPVSGVLPGPTDQIKNLFDRIKNTFRRGRKWIRFLRNGNVFEQLMPGTNNMDAGYPQFLNLHIEAMPSSGWVSLLRYSFEVVAEFTLIFSGITSFSRSREWQETEEGEQETRTVEASGHNCLLWVRAQQPPDAVSSTIVFDEQERRARGTFRLPFRPTREGLRRLCEAVVRISGGYRTISFVSIIGHEFPDRIYGVRTPATLRISGKIVSESIASAGRRPALPGGLSWECDVSEYEETQVRRRPDGLFEREFSLTALMSRRPSRASFDLYQP